MEENVKKEMPPKERYTFRYEEKEIREIHKKQLKPAINTLIANVIFIIIVIGFKLVSDMSSILFGVLLGIFILSTVVFLRWIISFRKSARAALAAMPERKYIYSVFDDILKIEVFEKDNKISEETRRYTDISSVNDAGAYYLFTVAGRIFVIRKRELAADSLLWTVFDKPAKKVKVAQRRVNIALIILLVSAVLAMAFGELGKAGEKHANDQATESMKTAIEKTYDEYELLNWFNVRKDGLFTDSVILVESDGKIDVLGYASENNELITVERYIGLTPEAGNVIGYLADGNAVVMRIYESASDIPDTVDIKTEIQYRDQAMYFCISFT